MGKPARGSRNTKQVPKKEGQSLSATYAAASFSGPLPPPETLAKYDAVLPGAADRVITMAEDQSGHRRTLEKRVVDGNVRAQTRGSWFAFIIALVVVSGGLWLISTGRDVAGYVAILAALAEILGVFIVGKITQHVERKQRRQDLLPRR